jgi:hypothetical protein
MAERVDKSSPGVHEINLEETTDMRMVAPALLVINKKWY